MCGIITYVGTRSALPILIDGLRRLEYRGYDSAGVAVLDGDLNVVRAASWGRSASATPAGPPTDSRPRPTPTRT
jgi:glucosamine 6-phosphate synthetase-like amidotransferase/phosphosugar isomerase protein